MYTQNTARQIISTMKGSYICILFVFATLIASAQSDTCRRCWTLGDTECCGNATIECPSSKCNTISEYCKIDDKEQRSIRKGCSDGLPCDVCLSLSTERGLTIREISRCATGDLSHDDLGYNVTCKSLEKENGYKCPACFEKGNMSVCHANGTVRCRGPETECVKYLGVIQIADGRIEVVSARGCIIKGGCEFGFAALIGTKEMARKVLSCTKPVPIVRRP